MDIDTLKYYIWKNIGGKTILNIYVALPDDKDIFPIRTIIIFGNGRTRRIYYDRAEINRLLIYNKIEKEITEDKFETMWLLAE